MVRFGGRIRRTLVILLLTLAAAGVYAFITAGSFLAREDALGPADAIFVFAGTRVERPMEAADLYRERYAPRVVITHDQSESAAAVAQARGVHVPSDFDVSRDVLLTLGVPEDALVTPMRIHDNTAQEAETLRALAIEHRWRRVIIVSSKYHLRRVALACRRALRGTGVEIVMRGSRYDLATPDRWWQRRSDIRWIVSEVPKLIGYAVGVGA